MQIDRLFFDGFRNLQTQDLFPFSRVNVLWGENGQGKTNILEAIYLFAHLKSFRGAGNIDLIHTKKDDATISATVTRLKVTRQLDLKINKSGRSFFLDGKRPRPVENLLDAFRAILFAPDELYPLRTLPAARRSLIDRGIFQLDPSYMSRAVEYDRILKQRNRLLREHVSEVMIRPWTEQLVLAGAKIRQARYSFSVQLQPYFNKTHEFLSNKNDAIALLYQGSEGSLSQQEERLALDLQRVRQQEIRLGVTCAGPHRDDPQFLLNGEPVRYLVSQGQWRTLILSFKMALMRLLSEQIGATPILLFDDMSAELDNARQEKLFSLLDDCNAQVFVTTTDPHPFLRYNFAGINSFQVMAGEVLSG